jgi:hypothetical protein
VDWLGGARFLGGMRVFRDPAGRVVRIGTDHVVYGPDGTPEWVGARHVTFDGQHRIDRIGGDLVRYGGDGRPAWVGRARLW